MCVNSLPQKHSSDSNDLDGSIPSQLGELTGLEYLYLCKYLILQGSNGAVEAFYGCFMH